VRAVRLKRIPEDEPGRARTRALVTGWRLRRYQIAGHKHWERLAGARPKPAGIWIDCVAARPRMRVTAQALRAVIAAAPAPVMVVVPPGTARRGGVLAKAFDCAGIFHWDQPGLAGAIDQWFERRGHLVVLAPEAVTPPPWLSGLIPRHFRLVATLGCEPGGRNRSLTIERRSPSLQLRPGGRVGVTSPAAGAKELKSA